MRGGILWAGRGRKPRVLPGTPECGACLSPPPAPAALLVLTSGGKSRALGADAEAEWLP